MRAFLRRPMGWLLRSVEYLATREIYTWHRTNPKLRKNQYGYLQKMVVELGSMPIRDCAGLAFLGVLIFINVVLWKLTGSMPASGAEHLKLPEGMDTRISYFTSLWIIQATVAALTFPIVISLVAMLFQQRDDSAGRLQIYLSDSCALLMGMSSLSLIFVMGVQYKFIWHDDPHHVEWVMVMDLVWFLINILGTMYFLFRSFYYIIPSYRAELIQRYTLTITWPRQARALYKKLLLLAAATDKEMLPEGHKSVYFGTMWSRMGSPLISRQFSSPRYLSNVYFRPLELGVWLWNRFPKTEPQNTSRHRAVGLDGERRLLFPLDFGLPYSGTTVICAANRGQGLGWFARLIVRLSISMSRWAPAEEAVMVDKVLEEMTGDVLEAVYSRKQIIFEERYVAFIKLYAALVESSEYTGLNGEAGNFTLIQSDLFLSRPRFMDWLSYNRDVAAACVDALRENPDYFTYMTRVPSQFLDVSLNVPHVEFSTQAIELGHTVFYQLARWWGRQAEEQGFVDHGKCAPVVLKAPFGTIYSRALDEFIGGYETLRSYHFPDPGSATFQHWEFTQKTMLLNRSHIEQLLFMLYQSIERGDRAGADASMDMLQKWCSQVDLRLPDSLFEFRNWRFTALDLQRLTRDEAEALFKDADNELETEGEGAAVLLAASIRNYWKDCLCMAVYGLLADCADCDCATCLPADVARNIIGGVLVKPGGVGTGGVRPVATRSELLRAIIRQRSKPAKSMTNYYMHMSALFEQLNRSDDQQRISGRIYSGYGSGPDLDTAIGAQLLYLMLLDGTDAAWHPEQELVNFVASLAADENDEARALHQYFTSMQTKLLSEDFEKFAMPAFLCIKRNAEKKDYLLARNEVNAGIGALVQAFAEALDMNLAKAPIDETYVRQIEKWASDSAFSKETSLVPVTLFDSVTTGGKKGVAHSLKIRGMNKGSFVTPQRAPASVNAPEWFSFTVRDSVAVGVTQDILAWLKPKDVPAASPETYWTAFMKAASTISKKGEKPILLIDGQMHPAWVRSWVNPRSRRLGAYVPDALQVTQDRPRDRNIGYMATFNDVEVYRMALPPGASLVVPKRIYDTIKFRTYDSGTPVTAKVDLATNNTVDLILTWEQVIKFDRKLATLATRLVYGQDGNPKN